MFVKRITAAVAGLGLLGAAALGVLATAHPAAAAPATPGAIVRTAGKITALQGAGFTLQGRNHTYNVAVGATTWIVVKKNGAPAQGALADLTVGEQVGVAGTATGTDGVDARVVTEGGAAGLGKQGAAKSGKQGAAKGLRTHRATVQSVANGVLTVSAGAGAKAHTVTISTDAGTIVIKNGLATVADLKAGDVIRITARRAAPAAGTPGTTGAPATAALIYVPSATTVLTPAVVKSVDGNAVLLRTGSKEHLVNVGPSTVVKTVTAGQAPAPAALSDLKAGSRVLVYGPKPAAGQTATASLVLIQQAK